MGSINSVLLIINSIEVLFIIFVFLLRKRILIIIALMSLLLLLVIDYLSISIKLNLFATLIPLFFIIIAMFFSRFFVRDLEVGIKLSRKASITILIMGVVLLAVLVFLVIFAMLK